MNDKLCGDAQPVATANTAQIGYRCLGPNSGVIIVHVLASNKFRSIILSMVTWSVMPHGTRMVRHDSCSHGDMGAKNSIF